MTIAHADYQLAARARALTLRVATTGLSSLGATATGFSRAAGSFLTDGFTPGMEVVGLGFSAANNAPKVITDVKTGFLTVAGGCTAQPAANSRSLTVGLPSQRAWLNTDFKPVTGVPFVDEQYIPGPMAQVTIGPNGDLELTPMYQLQIHVPANFGWLAGSRYADAALALFTPRTAIALTSGDLLRVRADVSSFRGQLLQSTPGFAVVPVTVPFRLRTPNTI
jgi:hypothetical protein